MNCRTKYHLEERRNEKLLENHYLPFAAGPPAGHGTGSTPGAGKTTVVPLALLEEAWLAEMSEGLIVLSGAKNGDIGKALLGAFQCLEGLVVTG